MPTYRIYFVDQGGHISRPPEHLDCADDQEAIQKLQQFVDGQEVELWEGARFIKRLTGDRSS